MRARTCLLVALAALSVACQSTPEPADRPRRTSTPSGAPQPISFAEVAPHLPVAEASGGAEKIDLDAHPMPVVLAAHDKLWFINADDTVVLASLPFPIEEDEVSPGYVRELSLALRTGIDKEQGAPRRLIAASKYARPSLERWLAGAVRDVGQEPFVLRWDGDTLVAQAVTDEVLADTRPEPLELRPGESVEAPEGSDRAAARSVFRRLASLVTAPYNEIRQEVAPTPTGSFLVVVAVGAEGMPTRVMITDDTVGDARLTHLVEDTLAKQRFAAPEKEGLILTGRVEFDRSAAAAQTTSPLLLPPSLKHLPVASAVDDVPRQPLRDGPPVRIIAMSSRLWFVDVDGRVKMTMPLPGSGRRKEPKTVFELKSGIDEIAGGSGWPVRILVAVSAGARPFLEPWLTGLVKAAGHDPFVLRIVEGERVVQPATEEVLAYRAKNTHLCREPESGKPLDRLRLEDDAPLALKGGFEIRTSTDTAARSFVDDAEPSLPPPKDRTHDSLSREEIEVVLRAQKTTIRRRYEAVLRESVTSAEGVVIVGFVVQPTGATGKVCIVEDTIGDDRITDTLLDVIKPLRFPKPRGGGKVFVNYPYLFNVDSPTVSGYSEPSRAVTAHLEPTMQPATLLHRAARPAYPRELLNDCVGGTNMLLVEVTKSGATGRIKLLKKTHPTLDRLAVRALKGYRWRAARVAGGPVDSRVRYRIRWDPNCPAPQPARPQEGTKAIVDE